MSYRLLPEVILESVTIPVRITRPKPHGGIFKMAMMRSVAAEAINKVARDFNNRVLMRRHKGIRDEKIPKALSLSSYGAMFVTCSVGYTFALAVFEFECFF